MFVYQRYVQLQTKNLNQEKTGRAIRRVSIGGNGLVDSAVLKLSPRLMAFAAILDRFLRQASRKTTTIRLSQLAAQPMLRELMDYVRSGVMSRSRVLANISHT